MPKRPAIVFGILVLIYVAARVWRLTDSCLWFDEIFSVHAASLAWGDIIPFVAKDLIHPPLFYFVLKGWMLAFGESLLALRTLPLVVSVIALFPLWMLCREMKLPTLTAAAAFFLFAVNGALIKYAQEVRMYSMLLFLSLVSYWLFSRYFFRGKSFWMLVLTNILLVNTHYFGWFVVVSEVLAILILQRIKILRTLLMLALTAIGFLPWVIAIFRLTDDTSDIHQNIGWMRPPGLRALIDFALDLVDPFYFQQSSVDAAANYWIAIPLLLLLAAAVVAYLVNFKDEPNKERPYFLAILSAAPLLMAFVLSWVMPVSIWGSRHLLIVFPPVIVLFSILLSELKPILLRNIALIALAAITIAAFVIQVRTEPPKQIWCSWEALAKQWSAAPTSSTAPQKLYVFEDLVAYHYWFATRGLANYEVILVKGIEGVQNDPAYFLPRGFDGVKTAAITDVTDQEIWISFRQPTGVGAEASIPNSGSNRRFEAPVTTFENLGYTVAEVKSDVRGTQTAFLVRMTKVPPDVAKQ